MKQNQDKVLHLRPNSSVMEQIKQSNHRDKMHSTLSPDTHTMYMHFKKKNKSTIFNYNEFLMGQGNIEFFLFSLVFSPIIRS